MRKLIAYFRLNAHSHHAFSTVAQRQSRRLFPVRAVVRIYSRGATHKRIGSRTQPLPKICERLAPALARPARVRLRAPPNRGFDECSAVSPASEQPLDIAELELHVGGPAV